MFKPDGPYFCKVARKQTHKFLERGLGHLVSESELGVPPCERALAKIRGMLIAISLMGVNATRPYKTLVYNSD